MLASQCTLIEALNERARTILDGQSFDKIQGERSLKTGAGALCSQHMQSLFILRVLTLFRDVWVRREESLRSGGAKSRRRLGKPEKCAARNDTLALDVTPYVDSNKMDASGMSPVRTKGYATIHPAEALRNRPHRRRLRR